MRFGRKISAQDQLDGYENVEEIVHDQDLSYVLVIIGIELTSHFGFKKRSIVLTKSLIDLDGLLQISIDEA